MPHSVSVPLFQGGLFSPDFDSQPCQSEPSNLASLSANNNTFINTQRAVLDSGHYPVIVGRGERFHLGQAMGDVNLDPDHVIMVYDEAIPENLRADYIRSVESTFADTVVQKIAVPSGEQSKSLMGYETVIEQILAMGISRDSVLIGLGGGVIGDLTGFVAATILRGIALVQCPTTLLAAVDSSIGGKSGINSRHGKNLIGAFYPPQLVIADTDCFATLPTAVIRHGYAEVIKIAAIQAPQMLLALEKLSVDSAVDTNAAHWVNMIARAVMLKVAVVNNDEREHNVRAFLNFGHTFAHALERLSGFVLAHGEAVAIGMMLANYTGQNLGITDPEVTDSVCRALVAVGLPHQWHHITKSHLLEDVYDGQTMLKAMQGDKKFRKGTMHFVFLPQLGENPVIQLVRDEDFLRVWSQVKNMIQHPPRIITDLHR